MKKSYDEKNFSYEKFWEQHNILSGELLKEIPEENLLDIIYDYVAFNVSGKYGVEEEKVLIKIPEVYRIVYMIRVYEGEINNGGFDQYFYNSTGYFIFDTIKYLEKIGARGNLEITKKALALVNSNNLTIEQFKSEQIDREIDYDDVSEQLNELDNEFYEYPDNLEGLLIKYIKDNIDTIN